MKSTDRSSANDGVQFEITQVESTSAIHGTGTYVAVQRNDDAEALNEIQDSADRRGLVLTGRVFKWGKPADDGSVYYYGETQAPKRGRKAAATE